MWLCKCLCLCDCAQIILCMCLLVCVNCAKVFTFLIVHTCLWDCVEVFWWLVCVIVQRICLRAQCLRDVVCVRDIIYKGLISLCKCVQMFVSLWMYESICLCHRVQVKSVWSCTEVCWCYCVHNMCDCFVFLQQKVCACVHVCVRARVLEGPWLTMREVCHWRGQKLSEPPS